MGKLWDTYETEKDGRCEIHFDSRNELFYIKYFDDHGKMFFTEEFPDKSIHYVRDAAENWCTGIKKLDIIDG